MPDDNTWTTSEYQNDSEAANLLPLSSADEQDEELNSTVDNNEGSSAQEHGPNSTVRGFRKVRKSPRTSCQLCKARKVKCDRALPACSWCTRNDRTCVYLERQKPGSQIASHLELEAKIDRVEGLVSSLGRRIEDYLVQYQSPSPHSTTTSLDTTESFRNNSFSRSEDEAPLVWSPGLGPLQSPTAACQGGDSHSEQQMPYGAANSSQEIPSLNSTFRDTSMSSATLEINAAFQQNTSIPDLPPHDVLFTLVDLYFKHCNMWCSVLDRKTTFTCFFGPTPIEEPNLMLLRAILVAAMRFYDGPQLIPEMKIYYYTISKQAVQIYAMQDFSVSALRALLIITMDELGTSNGPRAWNLLALLAQNVRQMDLWNETSIYLSADVYNTPNTGSIRRVAAGRPQSWIEDEGRRRLCWAVYLLDRYTAMATTTFDFMLSEENMNRSLPCSYDLFSSNIPVETSDRRALANATIKRPENLGSFSYTAGSFGF